MNIDLLFELLAEDIDPQSKILLWPVSVLGERERSDGYPYHITLKYFGEGQIPQNKVTQRMDSLDVRPPSGFSLEPFIFGAGTPKEAHVLLLKGVSDRYQKLREAFDDIRPDDFPEYKPHITVTQDLWERVKEEKLSPADLRIKIFPLEYRIGDNPVHVAKAHDPVAKGNFTRSVDDFGLPFTA